MGKKTKKSRVKAEKTRLEKAYADLTEEEKIVTAKLIETAAFMWVELEDLQEFLAENNWTEPFSQGNQKPYDRARPQGQSYNTTHANYQKTIKQLTALLPKKNGAKDDDKDGFENFVYGRDDR